MNFLYPYFLFAVGAIAIPVIIHFFNFKRYKTVYFSNVHLLKLIRQESKKKSQLKQLVILFSRILAITALAVAFSRPYIAQPGKNQQAANQMVMVYIDNSFSMKMEGEHGLLLEQARQKALQIANSYRVGTQFMILTNEFLPQHQFPLNRDQFIQQVTEIKETAYSPTIDEIHTKAAQIERTKPKNTEFNFFVISDFQKNSFNPEKISDNSTMVTSFMPLKSHATNNLMIDSCWFEIPGRKLGQGEKLFVRIKNQSEQAYQNIPIRLTINDTVRSVSNLTIDGKEQKEVELNFTNKTNGIQLCKVELDDYPVIYDNSYYLSYVVQGKLNALGIFNHAENGSGFLKALFADDEFVNYSDAPEDNLQISQIKANSCVFLINNRNLSSGLAAELSTFVNGGGTLVFFPGKSTNRDEYNRNTEQIGIPRITGYDSTQISISEVNYDDLIYRDAFKKREKDADLPKIKESVVYANDLGYPGNSLLTFRNNRAALKNIDRGKGTIYLFSFPLSQPNFDFIRHLLFVPTIYNMVLHSGQQQQYAYPANSNEAIALNTQVQAGDVKVVNAQTKDDFIAPVRNAGIGKQQLILDGVPKMAGHYLVLDSGKPIQAVSFNYSRSESDFRFYSTDELKNILQTKKFRQFQLIDSANADIAEDIQEYSNGTQLWKIFIVLAIFFVFTEMAVIRFWK